MKEAIDFLVKLALAEDIGPGDITTKAVIPDKQKAEAAILAKEAGMIAGLAIAQEVFKHIDKKIKFVPKVKDGAAVKKGKVVAVLSGPARGILTGERVALNFLQHLSGIATLTRKFKDKIKTRVKILDTRKTIPGMRALEKYAVAAGGGCNHRFGLYDAILIKDNHIKLAGGIEKAVMAAKASKALKAKRAEKGIEVEAKGISEVKAAIKARADRILLDNMSVRTLRQAVKLCKKARIETEASGGVNLNNVRAIAKTGVDYISIGALTHSAKALDISLKIS
jgi:nicotinate-nucleotide pyrophosphorylase (carboxylating)